MNERHNNLRPINIEDFSIHDWASWALSHHPDSHRAKNAITKSRACPPHLKHYVLREIDSIVMLDKHETLLLITASTGTVVRLTVS